MLQAILQNRFRGKGIIGKQKFFMIQIFEGYIAGYQFHQGMEAETYMNRGDELSLCREKDNPHDPWAVAIYFQEWKLGYLPQGLNKEVCRSLDRGRELKAFVLELNSYAAPWERVGIEVCEIR